MTQTTRPTTRAELWVNAPEDAEYEPLVHLLAHLETAGDIDDYVVYHWGHDLDVSSDRLRSVEDQLARERVAAFKQWATEHDCTVLGLGERATVGVGRMGPEVTVEHLPPVLLAEYVGDELQRVTPCSADQGHVSERLQALDSSEAGAASTAFGDVPDEEQTAVTTSPTTADETATALTQSVGRSLRSRLTRWRR